MKKLMFVLMVALTLTLALAASAQGPDSWTEYPGNPVFGEGVGGPKAYYPSVLYDVDSFSGHGASAKYKMWYGTSGNQTGLAKSEDGISWTDQGVVMAKGYHATVKYYPGGFAGANSGDSPSGSTMYYRIWYWDPSQLYNVAAMRYTESPDGVSWFNDQPLQNGAVPIVSGGDPWWNRGSYGPCDVLYNPSASDSGTDWTFSMYYDGTTGGDEAIGLGFSSDGVTWTGYDADGDGKADPVLSGTYVGGDWDYNYVSRATIIKNADDDYEMWYSGGIWSMNHGIGYATSSDGIHWTRDVNNPIFHKDDGMAWRDSRTYCPAVLKDAGSYKMWFAGKGTGGYAIGYATVVPPTKVWVDDDWTSQADVNAFDPSLIWQYDAFNSIQDGIDAVAGSTVNVLPGTYNERLTINKSLDLRGAQYGVDPTAAGARTNPANESIITEAGLPTPNPDVLIEIPNGVTNVTVDGFTLEGDLTNTTADTSVVRCWDDNITISHNIIDGMYGVLYKGNDTLTVHWNRIVVNKAGVTVQPNPASNVTVSDNTFNLGSGPVGDESAFYMTSCTQCSATGNTATSFNGRGIGGSNLQHLTISGNTLTGNRDAISIWGGSTFITIMDNILADSSRHGINIKGQDVDITGNEIDNSGDVGINIDRHVIDTVRVTILCNNISGNTNYGVKVNTAQVTEIINADYNWWGDPSGPFHPTSNSGGSGDAVSDGVDFDPWLSAPVDGTCPPPADDEGPITSNVVATPNPAPVNTAIVLTANVDDSTTGGSNIASAEYNIDDGSFVAMNAHDGGFDEVSEDVEAALPAFAEAGIHELCVQGTDAVGNVGSETCITLSVNAPPSVSAGGPYVGNEGSPISLAGLVDDPDGPSLTTTWTYVPVANVDEGATCGFGDANALATTFTCTDDGTYRVTLTGDDGINSPVEASADVTVHNVKPEVTITNPVDGDLFAVDTPVSLAAEFTDSSINDTHDCLISWDDGTAEPGAFSESNGTGTCHGSHMYSAAGVYAIQVTVTDDDGSVTTESVMIVVYDPEGGFVTGGGWIWSPPGAYTAAPELEGKATFGFVSKYKKGAQTPEGQTEFVFKAADLNFHSSSYDWLVVAGSRAKFKGTGTINGAGEYKFMLTALDADINENDGFDVDRFRIRIWFEVNGNEIVVYDNGLGADDDDNAATEIGGGAIVIHTKK